MGNALDFLKETEKRPKRGAHNRECREKVEEFKKTHEVTHCEDYNLSKCGTTGKLRVNEKFSYCGSIKKIDGRRFEDREEVKCACCEELFTPLKLKRPPTIYEKEIGITKFTIWCKLCTLKGTVYRDLIHKLGGVKAYKALRESLISTGRMKKEKSLRVLLPQYEARVKLGQSTLTMELYINNVITKAWEEHGYYLVAEKQPKHDF